MTEPAQPDLSVADEPETYRRAFLDSTDTIVVTDRSGRIVTANPAWCERYGYSLEEVRGQSTRIIQSEHTTRAMYQHMWSQIGADETGSWTGEIVNRTRGGEEVPILLTITPIRKAGEIVGYLGVGIDVTERKRHEQLRAMYELVVRHDLKAPLGSVLTILDTVLEGYAGPVAKQQRKLLERARAAGGRMQELIATSLDLAKLERHQLRMDPEDMDLVAAAREAMETLSGLARDKGLDLVLELEPPLDAAGSAPAHLDTLHVLRCLENVVKNAVEASPEGGRVVLRLAERDDGYELSVHNGGPPIPPDVQATLFHPFSTFGKRGGTGLGIYGVKLTVEAMGGQVRYETGGGGTTFTLALPRESRAER